MKRGSWASSPSARRISPISTFRLASRTNVFGQMCASSSGLGTTPGRLATRAHSRSNALGDRRISWPSRSKSLVSDSRMNCPKRVLIATPRDWQILWNSLGLRRRRRAILHPAVSNESYSRMLFNHSSPSRAEERRRPARDLIAAVLDNMRRNLEPLKYSTLAPSRYLVYVHPAEYARLEGIVPILQEQTIRALAEELDNLNRRSPVRRYTERVLGAGTPPVESAGGRSE